MTYLVTGFILVFCGLIQIVFYFKSLPKPTTCLPEAQIITRHPRADSARGPTVVRYVKTQKGYWIENWEPFIDKNGKVDLRMIYISKEWGTNE